jgi:hypothetical protein
MPKIFELFGFPLADYSPDAISYRKNAVCPFMGKLCDGGGNRYLSAVDTSKSPSLKKYFNVQGIVPAGVCALAIKEGEQPWIVCPRRLFTFDHSEAAAAHQSGAEGKILSLSGYPKGTRIGVWSEVKIKTKSEDASGGTFDYTFDYIVMPLESKSASDVTEILHSGWSSIYSKALQAGYQFATRKSVQYIENFPSGSPLIVEIMTSSTSGGDKKKRTQIPMAFEDAILGKQHSAPGINYRQVWARMVSQLIVKSEVALGWGGITIWLLQDTLADYISNTTALDLRKFLSEHTSEVNMLSYGYGRIPDSPKGPLKLKGGELFSGPISMGKTDFIGKSFQDIIRAPICPPKNTLLSVLIKKKMLRSYLVS